MSLIIGFNASQDRHCGLPSHNERPARFTDCVKQLLTMYPDRFLPRVEIDRDQIIALMKEVHTSEYVDSIMSFHGQGGTDVIYCRGCQKKTSITIPTCQTCNSELTDLTKISYLSPDTYYTPCTFDVVVETVHVLKQFVDTLAANRASALRYGYALVRPPGHHCTNKAEGFCVVNNVAVIAKYALTAGFSKVGILDIDFHHGNGTENLVKAIEGIYFISLHAFGPFVYPETGSIDSNNERILNVPIDVTIDPESRRYVTDHHYLNLVRTKVLPFVQHANLDLLIISNGLDGHRDDPLEGFNLSDNLYVELAKLLKTLGMPLLYVTEGGYSPTVVNNVSKKVIHELMN
jgi:acetoin utilization deacetylase AcuC-like enzyme